MKPASEGISASLNKRLLGMDEVAGYLGIKKSTVYAWVHTRKIPYYKVGRLVKFRLNEIDEWLRSGKTL